MSDRVHWTVIIFLSVTLGAAASQTRGALLPSFQDTFQISEGLLGLVAPASSTGSMLTVLLIGFLTGRLPIKRYLLLGTVGVGASLLLMGVSPIYVLFLLSLFMLGISTGVVHGLDRPILSHLYPERRGLVFNLYSLAWAVGAVAGPLLVNAILAVGDWRLTYLLLGVTFLPLIAALWIVDTPDSFDNESAISLDAVRRLLRHPPIVGMVAGMLILGGMEGGFFIWLPYFAGSYFPRETANVMLSVFLVAYIPGRAIYGALVERVGELKLLLAGSVCTAPLLYVVFVQPQPAFMMAGVFGLGLLISGLFPTFSVFGVETAPEFSGPVNALSNAAMSIGIATFPALIGVVAGLYGIEVAVWLIPAQLVALVAVLIGLLAMGWR